MSLYAKVSDGVVINIIVAEPEFFDNFVDSSAGKWIKTCIHTKANLHEEGGTALRKNCAIIGGNYDETNDAFYAMQPYPSWTLNKETYVWESPVAYPDDGNSYNWNEETKAWVIVES